MEVIELEWDSQFFGFPVGKVIADPKGFSIDTLKKVSGQFRLIYVQSDKPLQHQELTCGDTKVTFGKTPVNAPLDVRVEEALTSDVDQLKLIGLQSGNWSRFALDSKITKAKFTELYNEWVEGSMDKRLAYRNLTVKQNGVAKGLLTLGDAGGRTSSIGLFAVAEESRGKGLGRALLDAANNISFARNDQQLTVATQGKNEGACSVYAKSGFSVLEEIWIYNYWNESFAF